MGSTTAAAVIAKAQSTAASMLGQYDTTGKGYITEADLVSAWTANPSLGSVANAPAIFASFDSNSDGKLTRDELTTGSVITDIVHNLQSVLDPQNTGSIQVSNLPHLLQSPLIFSQNVIAGWDTNGDGTITNSELIAGVTAVAQNFIATYDTKASGSFTSADIASYQEQNSSTPSNLQPDELIAQWDTDGDGAVTLDEILGGLDSSLINQLTAQNNGATSENPAVSYETALSIFQNANASAASLLATYDTSGKGYIDAADLAASWTANPTLGDPEKAAQAIAQWDANGDGKVTLPELATGQLMTSLATKIDSILDPLATGQIQVSNITDATVSGLSYSASTIAGWDTNNDGILTSDEILEGVRSSLSSLLSSYGSPGATSFTGTDASKAIAGNPTLSDGVSAAAVVAHWDLDGDGSVTAGEIAASKLSEINANFTNAASSSDAMTTSSAVLQSAQKNALSMLSIYDPSQQGSINAADITTAFSTNPTLSGGQTAAEVMALFDLNSDGIIDPDELVSGSELQTLSDMVFQKLDPTNTGFITTTNLATADGSGLPFALSTIAKWDANGDGSITPAEAIKGIYSEVVSTIGQFDTSGKGYFDQADVQAVIDANPTQYGSYSAASVLSQWDVNGDGEVTPSDVLACMVASAKNAAAIPSTASGAYASAKTTADATMELFDATGKGSITRDDIAGTYNADASLGMPSDAPSTLSAWDVNGDGKVTELELMEDSIAAKMANSLLSQLDPEGTGAIDVSSLASSSISAPYLSDPATTIASWDKNGDGSISQSELISGIEAQASSFLSQYDMTGKGYFSQSDVQAVLDMNPSLSGITASGMMKEWDANGDGKVDMADVLSGLSMGQNPSAITWSSDTAPSADQVLAAMGLNTSSTATQSA